MENVLKDMVSAGAGDEESAKQFAKAEEMRATSLQKCSKVQFLVEIMDRMGCKINPQTFFKAQHCNGNINGGFSLNEDGSPSVVLCQNHIQDQEWMDRTMAHELIHAFDHCRAKIDWERDCDQHACSEIRAAALSGDCDWKYEVLRGHFSIPKQHQECVRRRAILSLQFNPMCEGKEAKCVDKVFDTCYKDTLPFPEMP
ncbi:mitochondrial inner membrane protease ATP23 [Achlya hypogyna]|uniref:Mitochondrial inner membrane protease ATP23 n=1 Tax=Achlya hypogyna TaxID=1202772 RepID=A0A1V9ZP15_ACHHY|nr:mitochondrial inner membrane protease ATP23 [Achlya hypogyna]